MRKTSLILIRTDKKEVYISRYNVRKTNGGQLVLELEERKGSIYQLNLDTEEAFVGIMKKNYYNDHRSKIKTQIGEALQEIAQEATVVVTLNDKDFETYLPYQIIIFYNNMLQERVNSKRSVDALENEIIIEVNNGQKDIFSLRKTNDSSFINLEKIRPEENPLYANIQNVEWINYKYHKSNTCMFTREWANNMLKKLLKVKSNDTIIYPTFKGKWIKSIKNSKIIKVLPKTAYEKELNGGKATKEFWKRYLCNIVEIEVEYPVEEEGVVIRQKYKSV